MSSENFTIAEFKAMLDELPEHYLVHFETATGGVFRLLKPETDPLFQIVDFVFTEPLYDTTNMG